MKHLLKHEYPKLKQSEYKKACDFINGKCSQYYFLDYMRCSNGNVDDAIQFFLLDEQLRNILFNFIIKFETQIKSDFSFYVKKATSSNKFWMMKSFFILESTKSDSHGRKPLFEVVKKKIINGIDKMHFETKGPINDVALYSCSFGTFEQLFKIMKNEYLCEFIEKYTKHLNFNNYNILKNFIEGIRRVRNRCAHGNHIISLKLVNDLNDLRTSLTDKKLRPLFTKHLTVLESIIFYLIDHMYCGSNLKFDIFQICKSYEKLIRKYRCKLSLSLDFCTVFD